MFNKSIAKLKIKNGEKYFQTLEGHAKDALKILREYLVKNYGTIDVFCERWKIDKEKFLRNLFLVVYLHDIGKLTEEFQENIRQNKKSQKYPHAYYGFFLLHNSFTDTIIDIPLELAAILGHHTQLYDQIYEDENQFEKPTFLDEEILKFVNNIPKIYRELRFDEFFEFKSFGFKLPDDFQRINPLEIKNKVRNPFVQKIKEYLRKNKNHIKVRSIFSYIFSVLQTCDDYASANFSKYVENYNGKKRIFDSVLKNPEEYVPLLRIKNPIKTVLKNKTPYKFQKRMVNPSKFMTLFAPCGRGKTEAALIWAIASLKKFKRNKIIFAMPTQTTSNAMYDRLKTLFGEENVGLYHGRSFIKLKDEKLEEGFEEEKDVEEVQCETFKGKVFFKPITITTVDHLIYSFVKGFSQADFALGNLQNAVIIFDEVHCYEKLTLEHLITLFGILKKMDIPHLLMSGTLPDFIIGELEGYEHIVDHDGLRSKPIKIEYNDENLIYKSKTGWKVNENVLDEIIKNYTRGLTQFVILNTIERAKQFYLKLKERLGEDSNIMLYHSQFTYSDRVKKENEIEKKMRLKPFILVATQVIEISLDISCDVMYSELAPPDAIGQRAGRLNRNGKTWKNHVEHKLKIYLPENNLPYEEALLRKDVIVNYQKPISYKEIKDICDTVYENYKIDLPSELLYYFRSSTIFGRHWANIATESEEGLKFKVRDEKIQYVDVIPEDIFKKYGEKALNIKYLAKIPLYYLLYDLKKGTGIFYLQRNEKGRAYWVCCYSYNYELGFNVDDKNFNTNDNVI